MSASVMLEFLYRVSAPILFLPWILTQFFAAGISWFLLALWTLWAWNTTVYYIPLVSFGVFVLVSPVQVNQKIVIGIVEQLASYLDTFIDDIIFPIIESLFYIASPSCWAFNFLWDAAMAIFRVAYWNPLTSLMAAIFPVNPFDFIMDGKIEAGSFPITTTIDTSSSPDWIVGPYDRRSTTTTHQRRYSHLLNGSRAIDPSDPLSRNLIRWMRKRQNGTESGSGKTTAGKQRRRHDWTHVNLVVYSSELDTWTDPNAPPFIRRTISERVLRRTIDRELGIETKGWWEPDPDSVPETWTGSRPPRWIEESSWSRVFGNPTAHIDWGSIGIVELDSALELPEYAKAQGLRVPPGSKSYRYLTDDKGERSLSIFEFQAIAEVVNILFDKVANVLYDGMKIMYSIGTYLFNDLVDFFDTPIEFMANLMNQIFEKFLELPCLKFDSVEVFAISLLDCICAPLRQAANSIGGGWTTGYWNYQRPTDISELPQAIMSCIGLGCLDIDTILAGGPTIFFSQLISNCFQAPDGVACCILEPQNCILAVLLKALPCKCSNAGIDNVQPPQCAWPNTSISLIWQCILRSILKLLGCRDGTFDMCTLLLPSVRAVDFLECLATGLLNLDFFIDTLTSFIDIDIPDTDDLPFRKRTNIVYESRLSAAGYHPEYADTFDYRSNLEDVFDANDHVAAVDSISNGVYNNNNAKNGPESDLASVGYLEMSSMVNNSNGQISLTKRHRSSNPGRGSDALVDNDRYYNHDHHHHHHHHYYGSEYQVSDIRDKLADHYLNAGIDSGPDDKIDLYEARMRYRSGRDPFEAESGDSKRSPPGKQPFWNHLIRSQAYGSALWSKFIRTMERESPERHRARIRAEADRLLFNNPYIRVATSRMVGVLRGFIDRIETQQYGPDPFVRRPIDSPPLDPDDIRLRYEHHGDLQQQAYMMHAQAIAENPYYAGMYKVMFQVGGVDEMGREDSGYDEAMDAMALHKDNPLFHLGRMMSGSRQLYNTLGSIMEEVWWDSDSFSFHFPMYPQIHEVILRSHLPTFFDDMRSAGRSWLRCKAEEADADLNHQTVRYIVEEESRDPEMEAVNHPFGAHGYSWMVQSEIAIRSATMRLLSPRHLQPMLEQVATHSPIHAHYAYRMSQRVEALRDASPHYERTFENDLDRMLEKYLDEAREEMEEEAAMRAEAGFLGLNQLTMRLDPDAHPDLGNRSLSIGERVRFEDGKTGVFLGTQAHLDRSLVTERDSPTRSLFDSRGVEVGAHSLHPRAYVVVVFKVIVKTFEVIWKYRRFIVTGLVALVTTPWGRVVWESWLSFFWRRVVRPLYTDGLRSLFSSFISVVRLISDFATLNTTVLLFLVNELMRYVLCFVWALIIFLAMFPLEFILNIISFGALTVVVGIIAYGILVLSIVIPNCPPEQVIDGNKMTQSPTQYLDDIVRCFGEINLNDVPDNFGKDAYNGICHVPQDCPGNAPCVCENKGGQLSSFAVVFSDTTPCGTQQAPTGQCLCYPKFNCEFLFPRIGLESLFDIDCRDYGYELDNIVWYQTSDWFLILWNAHNNFWVSLRYITRTLTRAPGIPPLLFPVLITVGMIALLWIQWYTGAIIIGLVLGFQYGLPQWKRLVVDVILPAMRIPINTGIPPFSNIADWAAGFLRFPNHSTGSPLGHMRSGEGICFIFNTGTLFGGASVVFFFWGMVILLLWYGMGPILWLGYNLIMTPVRMVYAPIWLYLQQSGGQESVDAFKDKVRRFIPGAGRAMEIGSDVWTRSRPYREAMIPRQPNTFLNRWVGDRAPQFDAAFTRYQSGGPRPIIIRGAMPGIGGGTLDHEIYRGTQQYAGVKQGDRYRTAHGDDDGAPSKLSDWATHRIDSDVRKRRANREASAPLRTARSGLSSPSPMAQITEIPDDDRDTHSSGSVYGAGTVDKDK